MHPIIIALALIVAGWLAMLLTATAIDKPDITVVEFCNRLLQGSAELKAALDSATTQPGAVLVKILSNDANAHYLEPGTGIWVGGEPQLIQNPHDAECEICRQPMRFLFSAGDFTEEMAFGDVGVAYIYGCDTHPQHCQGFVDCH